MAANCSTDAEKPPRPAARAGIKEEESLAAAESAWKTPAVSHSSLYLSRPGVATERSSARPRTEGSTGPSSVTRASVPPRIHQSPTQTPAHENCRLLKG
ncbi:hypothetical protein NDU88_002478 [Pleurodeles waltl]|uniref:Uncharacterized protein n=1 Tax=Pleurodeles waltl TaxID=8319 RepID=A0AAV7PA40_PLEWA|nr:hypothetical protein NDU88_002478 [Pleurodeles waltl]